MTSISNLFNHFMSLVGLNHYNKSESDDKYATKTHNHSEYLTSHQDITGKVDKAQGSSNKNKNVVTDSNGNISLEAKPVIPTKTSDLTNDSNYVTTTDSRLSDARTPKTHTHGNISNDGKIGSDSGKIITTGSNGVLTASSSITKSLISDFPSSMTPTSHSHGSLANGGTLNSDISSVNKIAVTDSSNNLKTISQLPYSKISGTPSIPTKTSDLTNNSGFLTSHNPVDDSLSSTSTNAVQNKVINTALNGKANSSHEHSSGDVKDNSAYSNIGSSANATQKTINDKINTALGLKANSSNVYTKSETYTQSEITTAISNAVSNLQLFEVVSSLPTSNIKTNRLYLMVNGETIANNSYDIYLRVNNSWEQLDSLEFDISNFYNKTEIDTLLDGKVSTSDSRLTDSRTPKSHSHGNITNTGTLSGKGQNVVTDSNGAITTEAKPTIPTKTSDLTNDGDGTNVFVKNNDSRLSDSRTPTTHTHTKSEISDFPSTMTPSSHTHGNLQNDGTVKVSGTVQKSKNLVTDSSGNLSTEDKYSHPSSHPASMITGLATVATTGSYGSLSNKPSFTQDSNITSSTTGRYAIGTINVSGSDVTLYGKDTDTVYTHPNDLNTTKTSGLYKVALNTKGHVTSATAVEKEDITGLGIPASDTVYTHPTELSSALSTESLYKIKANTKGHITSATSVGIDSTNGGTSGSGNLITSGAVYSGLSGKSNNGHTHTSSEVTDLSTTIANAISGLELVEILGANDNLPSTNIKKKLYLKPNGNATGENKYDIYVYANSSWEKIDSLDFNISDYLKISDASSTYLSKTDASNTYLSKTDAGNTYQAKGSYLTSSDISGKEDTSNKVKSTSSLSSSSTDDQYASAKLIYNTLIKSDSTTKNGHTHNYTTSSDVDTKVSSHNSSNSAHSDIRNAIPSDISDLTDSEGVIPTDTSDLTNGAGFLTSHNPVDDSLNSTSTNAVQNKVINTALNGKEDINNKSSNITTDTGSTTKYPTVQAVENYVNSKVDASFKVEVIQNYSVQDLEDDYTGNDGNAFGRYIDDEGLNYDANTIYLLYNDDLVYGRGSYYNEYILINDTGQYPVFELLGTTQMDLSGLLTKSEADTFYQPLGNYLTSLPSHNHNDLYYTESEVNSLLNSKLNTSDFATQLEAVIDSLITEAQS